MENFEIELKITTLDELEDTLNELYDELISVAHTESNIDALFRAAHSIKGNSRAADFDGIASITHIVEDLLLTEKGKQVGIPKKLHEILLLFSEQLISSIESLRKNIEYIPNFSELAESINFYKSHIMKEDKKNNTELKKVLLIDDDIDIYNIVSKYLMPSVEIDYVSNAVQAIEDCKLEKYDIIICDYKMPVMDGQEFILYLKQGSSPNKHTPIIFLTAYSPKLFSEQSVWENVYFLSKPIEKKRLIYYTNCAIYPQQKRGKVA